MGKVGQAYFEATEDEREAIEEVLSLVDVAALSRETDGDRLRFYDRCIMLLGQRQGSFSHLGVAGYIRAYLLVSRECLDDDMLLWDVSARALSHMHPLEQRVVLPDVFAVANAYERNPLARAGLLRSVMLSATSCGLPTVGLAAAEQMLDLAADGRYEILPTDCALAHMTKADILLAVGGEGRRSEARQHYREALEFQRFAIEHRDETPVPPGVYHAQHMLLAQSLRKSALFGESDPDLVKTVERCYATTLQRFGDLMALGREGRVKLAGEFLQLWFELSFDFACFLDRRGDADAAYRMYDQARMAFDFAPRDELGNFNGQQRALMALVEEKKERAVRRIADDMFDDLQQELVFGD